MTSRESPQFPVAQPRAVLEDRGRLLDANQVAQLIGGVTPEWVRRCVPRKRKLGHATVRWWESDVQQWVDTRAE